MTYTYILKSINHDQFYYGHKSQIKLRLAEHNSGKCKHTSKYKPWQLVWYGAFETEELARSFEKYLKTASGKAFARKRIISTE